MVEASLVASAALSAFVLLAIGVALARSRHRHPSLLGQATAGEGFTSTGGRSIDRWTDNPTSWVAAFLLFTFGAAGTVVATVAAEGFGAPFLYGSVVAAAIGLIYGSYAAGRNAGLGTAGSTFVTAILVGLLAIVGVVSLLVTG